MSDPKTLDELKVYRGELFAGLLKRTKKGCTLELDEAFINNAKYDHFTYNIKKTSLPLHSFGVNLPPFFAGLLPEGLRLKALVKELKTSEDDLFSLLAVIGERSVGDIYVTTNSEAPINQSLPKLQDLDFYELFNQHLKNGFTSRQNDGLAGVQEKLSASMISFPIRIAKKNKTYILKLNPKDKPYLVHNEHQCLLLAKKCGLNVNKSQIVYDKNNNSGLLVERFDRAINKDFASTLKVHQEDACQFLQRYPADKYRISFEDICTGIKNIATAPTIEILKSLQIYIFSYLIGNGDLHAKNISLQTHPENGRIQLTPIYDVICTYIYSDQKMALKLGGRDINFKRKYFIKFAEQFGINEKSIGQTIDKLISKVETHLHILLEANGLTAKDKKQIENLFQDRKKELL